ncbi:DUF58 domain-containing protein [Chitinispirillales bacterium ANBcel5]|uniref:DUF58 domain-containing protein n=1 Tax=Cellulosispirillum alkaliphilum TaxID=3039283 RepID=UPI002A548689|nr:DUF58 domain-containing protein [Chitinispirillales bacterium ANBcel5]
MSQLPGPEEIASIRNLSLRAKHIVEGMIAGMHKSPFHGFSAEFLEFRPYLTGEPARKIDWRKYAKTEKPLVRLFEDETNLSATILIDKSASMAFTSGTLSKLEYAKTLAASLAWILVKQKDAVGMAVFDDELRTYVPPASTNVQLKTILSQLQAFEAGASTRCGGVIDRVASGIKKRGMCIVLSDLLDDPEDIIKGFKHLRYKRQDTVVLCIGDPMELGFGGDSVMKIRDMETGKEITLDSSTASEHFHKGISEHHAIFKNAAQELKIDFEIISTAEPFQKALMRIIEKRRRLF